MTRQPTGHKLRAILSTAAVLAASVALMRLSIPHRAQPPAPTGPRPLPHVFARLPLSFEVNEGQADPKVKFLSHTSHATLLLSSREVVLNLHPRRERVADLPMRPDDGAPAQPPAVLRMKLAGANPSPQVEGVDRLTGVTNYLIGDNPARWHTKLPNYASVRYAEVYSGIDLVLYGHPRGLEYDFVVRPGADPRAVRLAFEGAEDIALLEDGSLRLQTAQGPVVQQAPVMYQDVAGTRRQIGGGYVLEGKGGVRFDVDAYDPEFALIIDPVLVYSTRTDPPNGMAVDALGNMYVTGSVSRGPRSESDAYVAKLNAAGTALVYVTYLGGSGRTGPWSIAVDSDGYAYVTGGTAAADFPTVAPFQPALSPGTQGNAFLSKLKPDGSGLVYSTFLGGSGGDVATAIALDAARNVYITGNTVSNDFPTTPAAFQRTCNPRCGPQRPGDVARDSVFVAKFDAAGSTLMYSTYLGGSHIDRSYDIAVDSSGSAYVTGETASLNFPLANPLQGKCGSCETVEDVFVTKLNPLGSALIYSTYLGGASLDEGWGIAVDSSGNAYVSGNTHSDNFPVANPIQARKNRGCPSAGWGDAFIVKLNANGSALVYSTYLGGVTNDGANDVAVDREGNAYLTGRTNSADFPTTTFPGGPCDVCNVPINDQVFVAKLNAAGSALIQSTYFGGSESEQYGKSLALSAGGDVFIAGYSPSNDFPTTNRLSPGVGFVARFTDFDKPLEGPSIGQGSCTDLAGSWQVRENWGVTCTLSAQGTSQTTTENVNASASVRLRQDAGSCSLTATPFVASGSAFPSFVRSGTISGLVLTLRGAMGFPVSGATLLSAPTNRFDATGTIQDNRTIALTGMGRFVGTMRTAAGVVNVDCTGSSTATATRCSPPRLQAVPQVSSPSVVNGASFAGGLVAPDSWVDLYGRNLAPRFALDGNLPDSLDGTTLVTTDSQGTTRRARLHFVSPDRIQFLVPVGLAPGTASLRISSASGESTATIAITTVAPGLFSANASGQGPAAATFLRVRSGGERSDGFTFTLDAPPNRANVPIDLGPAGDEVYISFYGTGFRSQRSAEVRIGGIAAPVLAAAAQGQFAGLDQLVVGPLPRTLAGRRDAEIAFVADGKPANVVTISIR